LHYNTLGRSVRVTAIFRADDEYLIGQYQRNRAEGVIAVRDGLAILADMNDKGVKA
jgi:hypothetical protein